MVKVKILIADDTFFMRETLKKYLDCDRYEVHEAKNGAEAVKKYIEVNPHVVSLDITMPEMDGKEALIKIKQYDKTANVMMSTALGQEAHVKECLLYGCSNYLVKPFAKDAFLQKIEEMIKRGILAKKCPYEKECGPCGYKDICRIEK